MIRTQYVRTRYVYCIQTHNWGTQIIKNGTKGEITKIDNDFITILVKKAFLYKIKHIDKPSKWAVDIKSCLYYEYNIDKSYIDKYKHLNALNKTSVDRLYFKLVRSDIKDMDFIAKIKNDIDKRIMDQALS